MGGERAKEGAGWRKGGGETEGEEGEGGGQEEGREEGRERCVRWLISTDDADVVRQAREFVGEFAGEVAGESGFVGKEQSKVLWYRGPVAHIDRHEPLPLIHNPPPSPPQEAHTARSDELSKLGVWLAMLSILILLKLSILILLNLSILILLNLPPVSAPHTSTTSRSSWVRQRQTYTQRQRQTEADRQDMHTHTHTHTHTPPPQP